MPLKRLRELFTPTNIFAFICTVCTCYLLVLVVLNFAVTRPTSTSTERVELDLSSFPDVVACVDPPYKNTVLQQFGYSPWTYYRGGSVDENFIGWNGVNGKLNSSEIMNEVLSVAVDEELIGEIYFQDKIGKRNHVKAQSRMLLYPHGRCLVIKPPIDKIESFKYLYLKSITTDKFNHSELPSYLKVFLMDPINDPPLYPIDLQMKGDHIQIPLNRGISWFYFIIRVSRSYHVTGDPLFDCREYSAEETYGECVQDELKQIFEEKLSCSPPVLAKRPAEMCNERFNQTKEESEKNFQLFWNHYYNFEPSICKTPCTKTTYEVRLTAVSDYDKLGTKLTFEPDVHVTRSVFSSTMVDFLTSLGGSVSYLKIIYDNNFLLINIT